MKKIEWAWHIHHDKLVEPLLKSIKSRIAFIKKNKPEEEQELRLKLLKKVKGKLPEVLLVEKAHAEWEKAYAEREKAYTEWEKAYAKWEKADAKWEKAYTEWKKKYQPQILVLHKKECLNCSWNGKTIFSKSNN